MKIILTILVLISLLHENWSYKLYSLWQVRRYFCNFDAPPNQLDATVYSTCLWRTWSIFNDDGSVNQENVSHFLSTQMDRLENSQIIRDGFQTCLNRGLGQNLAERSFFLWKCLKTADLIRKMDQNPPSANFDTSDTADMQNYYEVIPA